jgi:hypothetical protein
MNPMHAKSGGFLAASALAALLAACAGSQYEASRTDDVEEDMDMVADTLGFPGNVGDAGRRSERSRIWASGDTIDDGEFDSYSGTEAEGGTGAGGTGEDVAPLDPTATDTAGEYGDPNAWPTGPLPGDTGVGGAGSPTVDTIWMDTLEPGDTLIVPDEAMPGSTGPDIW